MDEQQPEQPAKNKGGRPLGSKNKVGGRPTPKNGWLRDLFAECFTREEYKRKFKLLDDKTQFELITKVEPRSVDIGGDGTTIRLMINGITQGAVDVTPPPRALPSPSVDLPVGKAAKCDVLRDLH